jgi:hypothetical protein
MCEEREFNLSIRSMIERNFINTVWAVVIFCWIIRENQNEFGMCKKITNGRLKDR